jgi:uncharacterized protein
MGPSDYRTSCAERRSAVERPDCDEMHAVTDPRTLLETLCAVLDDCASVVVACSGGIDSLVLATVAHRHAPTATVVGHTVTPAVPGGGTARVLAHARREGWRLELVRSSEFDDERYLTNPADRCYFCKSNLYDALDDLRLQLDLTEATVLSGANVDDLGDYRPGLVAAAEHDVRHPYVEAGTGKSDIRLLARHLGLAEAELPASPCLASRLYTGTRVTATRLRAVEVGEAVLREAGMTIARCRLREDDVLVEVPDERRAAVGCDLLDDVAAAMCAVEPRIRSVRLDPAAYRPGRAVIHIA